MAVGDAGAKGVRAAKCSERWIGFAVAGDSATPPRRRRRWSWTGARTGRLEILEVEHAQFGQHGRSTSRCGSSGLFSDDRGLDVADMLSAPAVLDTAARHRSARSGGTATANRVT
jgi:hypothetical protein